MPERANGRTRPGQRRRDGEPIDWHGLTGIPRLLAHEYAWTATLAACVLLFGLIVAVAVGRLTESGEQVVYLMVNLLLIFDGTQPSVSTPVAAFGLLVCYLALMAVLAVRFCNMLRHLRVLPLGSTRLNTLLLIWPVIIWLSVGAALASARYIFRHDLPSVNLLLVLTAMAGVSALVQAASLWFVGAARGTLIAALLVAISVLRLFGPASPTLFACVGTAGFALAAWMNRQALARAETYKSESHAFLSAQPVR